MKSRTLTVSFKKLINFFDLLTKLSSNYFLSLLVYIKYNVWIFRKPVKPLGKIRVWHVIALCYRIIPKLITLKFNTVDVHNFQHVIWSMFEIGFRVRRFLKPSKDVTLFSTSILTTLLKYNMKFNELISTIKLKNLTFDANCCSILISKNYLITSSRITKLLAIYSFTQNLNLYPSFIASLLSF